MYNGAPMAGLSPIDETPGREGEAKRLEHVLMNLLAERDRLACRCAEGEEALRVAEEKLKESDANNAALMRQLQAVLPEIEVRTEKKLSSSWSTRVHVCARGVRAYERHECFCTHYQQCCLFHCKAMMPRWDSDTL